MDVDILTIDSYLTQHQDYTDFCTAWSLLLLVKRDLLSPAKPSQTSWPHASGWSATLPLKGFWVMFPWEEGMENSTNGKKTSDFSQSSCCWLIHPIQWHGRSLREVLRSMSFWFPNLKPNRYCTIKYLFPGPSHLLTSFKNYQFWRWQVT